MLTYRETRCFKFIVQYQAENEGVSPGVREMQRELKYKSPRTVLDILEKLEQKGRIRRLPGRKRAIEVLKAIGCDCVRLKAENASLREKLKAMHDGIVRLEPITRGWIRHGVADQMRQLVGMKVEE